MFFVSYFHSVARQTIYRPSRFVARLRDTAYASVSRAFQGPRMLLGFIGGAPWTFANWAMEQNIALRERSNTAHLTDMYILRSRIENLEEEVSEANKSVTLSEQDRRELHQSYAHQSHQFDIERDQHKRTVDNLRAEISSFQDDLARADADQETAIKLLEDVESELKSAHELVQSLSAKASSLEVKYEEKKVVLTNVEKDNATLKAEVDAKEFARILAAGKAKELAENLAYAEAYSLELAKEKTDMAARLELVLQQNKELEAQLAERNKTTMASNRFLVRSSIVSWLAKA